LELAAWALVALATHMMGFVLLSVMAAFVACGARTWRAVGRIASGLLPGGALLAIWRVTLVTSTADQLFLNKPWQTGSLAFKFMGWPRLVLDGPVNPVFRALPAVWLIIIVMIVIVRWPVRAPAQSQLTARRIETALACGMTAFYFAAPYSFLTGVWLFHRLAFPAAACLSFILPRCPAKHETLLIGIMTLLCITTSGSVIWSYQQFSGEAAPLINALRRLPPGQRLLEIVPESTARSKFVSHYPYVHQAFLYQWEQNGSLRNPFAALVHIPIRYNPPAEKYLPAVWPKPPAEQAVPVVWDMIRSGATDAVLARIAPGAPVPCGDQLLPLDGADRFRSITVGTADSGGWWLISAADGSTESALVNGALR